VNDWLDVEAPHALAELRGRVSPVFASHGRRRSLFEGRLEAVFPDLFRSAYRLFGWRYDFAWVLEGLVGAAAESAARRGGRLRRRSARPSTVWISVPADLDGPEIRAALEAEPVSHVHVRGEAVPGDASGPLGIVVDLSLPADAAPLPEFTALWRRVDTLVDAGAAGIVLAPSGGLAPLVEPVRLLSTLLHLLDPGILLVLDDPSAPDLVPGVAVVDPRPAAALASGSGPVLAAELAGVAGLPTGLAVHPAPLTSSGQAAALAVALPGIPELVVTGPADLAALPRLRPLLAARRTGWPAGPPDVVTVDVLTGAHPEVVGVRLRGGELEIALDLNLGPDPRPPVVPVDAAEEGWTVVGPSTDPDRVPGSGFRLLVRSGRLLS